MRMCCPRVRRLYRNIFVNITSTWQRSQRGPPLYFKCPITLPTQSQIQLEAKIHCNLNSSMFGHVIVFPCFEVFVEFDVSAETCSPDQEAPSGRPNEQAWQHNRVQLNPHHKHNIYSWQKCQSQCVRILLQRHMASAA